MTQAPIRSRIDQTLDVHRECFSKIALDLVFLIDNLADLDDLVLTEIFDPDGAIDPGLVQNVSGGRPADAEYIGQADVRPFFSRQIHSCNTCHIPLPPLRHLQRQRLDEPQVRAWTSTDFLTLRWILCA